MVRLATFLKAIFFVITITTSNLGLAENPDKYHLQVINYPNFTIFDSNNLVERLHEIDRENLCNPITSELASSPLSSYIPEKIIGFGGWGGYSKNGLEFSQMVSSKVSIAMKYVDNELSILIVKRLTNKLYEFASNEALFAAGPRLKSAQWAVTESLQLLLPSWQVIKTLQKEYKIDDFFSSKNKTIDDWLISLTKIGGNENVADGNHFTGKSRNYIYSGILFNRIDWVNKGIDGYISQIDKLRADGSFPEESRRGMMANVYTNKNISFLLQIAEMGLAQGINLYEYKNKYDVGIHKAIEFAIKSHNDNSFIDAYANNSIMDVPEKYAIFEYNAQAPALGDKQGHWVLYYINRFPDHPNAAAISIIINNQMNDPNWHSRDAGGNITCTIGWKF